MSTEKDILEEIRDKLGTLPEKLAETLRLGRQARFASEEEIAKGQQERPAGTEDTTSDRYEATENLLGAAGRFVPGLSELAGIMRDVRHLEGAWKDFAESWKSAAPVSTPPLDNSSEVEQLPVAEPIQTHGIQDDWKPAEMPPTPSLPEPYSVKPDAWRLEGFESLPESHWWQPFSDQPKEPDWMSQKPEIGLAPDLSPQEKPDLQPLRGTPEGWNDVQPLLPLTAREGWQDMLTGTASSGGGTPQGGNDLSDKIDNLTEKIEDLTGAIEEMNTEREGGTPSSAERIQGGYSPSQEQTTHTISRAGSHGSIGGEAGMRGRPDHRVGGDMGDLKALVEVLEVVL